MPLDTVELPRRTRLTGALFQTRRLSNEIASPLSAEDRVVQASDDASPAKWHLAHTTWFFEELILKQNLSGYRVFDERFSYCFNSYYNSLGDRHPRGQRGLLTRPSAEEVASYRHHVDAALAKLVDRDLPGDVWALLEIGINHEQQHQELMLTDILALFDASPLLPVYREAAPASVSNASTPSGEPAWVKTPEGIYEVGHGGSGFFYDNEGPRHKVYLDAFRLASRTVTNGEWLSFIDDGGYANPLLWVADGWSVCARENWGAPGYWRREADRWMQMTLHGLRDIERSEPVCHVSFYEADAFARWAGARLPTEFEWEIASLQAPFNTRSYELSRLRPEAANTVGSQLSSMGDGVWEWTSSDYAPYPRYRPAAGPLGEYNGKFMCNQKVLRGGSVATPPSHSRRTYRNFFYPHQRWQFMGLRLANEA